MKKKLVFLCGARDFHAMDWYRSAKSLLVDIDIIILTDLITGEGFKKLIEETDKIERMIVLDNFLFRKQSKIAHYWRNLLKLIIFPVQVYLIKRFSKKNTNSVYHAHSMYYLFLAWMAKIPYIGTPQGSDILIKPNKSYLYKYFTIKSLRAAKAITVDSIEMKSKIFELSGVNAFHIQNGIDIDAIIPIIKKKTNKIRDKIISIRGCTPLYRIKDILQGRNNSTQDKDNGIPLTFIYPFNEKEYYSELKSLSIPEDSFLGRLNREEMYELLLEAKLVISIPISDSSPRSVYEAIFCGAAVAITHHPYYETLPDCMKSRIILVDLKDNNWFKKMLSQSERITTTQFHPHISAVNTFNQKNSFLLLKELFNLYD